MLMSSFLSACVTSIIRTVYTWKFADSQDKTYWVCQMGLWTEAEIAIEIIVSCLPILPRFIQFIGPKIYGGFSKSWLRHLDRMEKNSLHPGKSNALTALEYESHPQTTSMNGPYELQADIASDSFVFSQPKLKSAKEETLCGSNPGIWVERTTQIEFGPNTDNIFSSDVADQRIRWGW